MYELKAVIIYDITDAKIPLHEVGDILVAEQIVQQKSEPDLTSHHSDEEDNGPIVEGIFTAVW